MQPNMAAQQRVPMRSNPPPYPVPPPPYPGAMNNVQVSLCPSFHFYFSLYLFVFNVSVVYFDEPVYERFPNLTKTKIKQ